MTSSSKQQQKSLLCRNISFEFEMPQAIIIYPPHSNSSSKSESNLSLCEKKGELAEEEDHEPTTSSSGRSRRETEYQFRDLLIKQLKFYANWYLLEFTYSQEEEEEVDILLLSRIVITLLKKKIIPWMLQHLH